MRLFREVVECKIIDQKPDKHTEEELGITEISIIKYLCKIIVMVITFLARATERR
jgi:hypothetical protein